ncbi:MAG: hypothetical protein PHG31_01505 [Candidatus Omnitrophica bacterium]|nr:hypothetical protein [Candidatus Omnitrophota bacterium]
MDELGFEDRRVFERCSVRLAVKYCGADSYNNNDAETYNICAKGLCLVTSQELCARTIVGIWLYFPHHKEPLFTRGMVVWSKSTICHRYMSGIDLEEPDLMGSYHLLKNA